MTHSHSVLFVCTGNIRWSPLAEGVLQLCLDKAGHARKLRVNSAGAYSYSYIQALTTRQFSEDGDYSP
jgi:protein-tyrosine-phosphatase